MTTQRLIKSIGRSRSRLALLLIPLVFACFALSPMALAVSPPPDGGYSDVGGAAPEVAKRYRYDFNLDGYPDYVIVQPTTDQPSPLLAFPPSQTKIWYLRNQLPGAARLGPIIARDWVLTDAADFNGDGYPDYALLNTETGQTKILYLRDNVEIGHALGPPVPNGWRLQKVGDFNRDGKPDYVLVNSSTRQTAIWYMDNNRIISRDYGPTLDPGWDLQAVADFDSDGLDDYLLFTSAYPERGATKIWYIVGRRKDRVADGPPVTIGWLLRGAADFNKDGHPDYLLYRQNSKQTAIWYLNNNRLIGQAFGPTIPRGWFPSLPSGG